MSQDYKGQQFNMDQDDAIATHACLQGEMKLMADEEYYVRPLFFRGGAWRLGDGILHDDDAYIFFCPYCGEKLPTKEELKKDLETQTQEV